MPAESPRSVTDDLLNPSNETKKGDKLNDHTAAPSSFLEEVEKERTDKVEKDIGVFFAKPLARRKDTGGPKVGMFQFDDGNDTHVKRFVYVPEDFDFTIYSNMEILMSQLEGMKLSSIDNIFRFPMNFSVAPGNNGEQKSFQQWRDHIKSNVVKSLVDDLYGDNEKPQKENVEMAKDSFPDPNGSGSDDPGNDKGRIKRILEDLENTFSAISDFENTVFLITDPFKGNKLSEIALKALNTSDNSTVQSIGLFHTGEIDTGDVLDGRLTVLRDYSCKVGGPEENQNNKENQNNPASQNQIKPTTPYEKKIRCNINEARKKKERMMFCAFDEEVPGEKGKNEQTVYYRTRIPIPDAIFSLNTVPYNEAPKRAIQVDCGLSDGEKEFKKSHRDITYIPGGLADKCDHILVFTSQSKLRKFTKHFCDLHPSGLFACGGSKEEFEATLDALKNGKPLFGIKQSGFTSTVARYFFNSTTSMQHKKDLLLKSREDMKVLQKELNKLTSPDSNLKNVRAKKIDELDYEIKFRELVFSIKKCSHKKVVEELPLYEFKDSKGKKMSFKDKDAIYQKDESAKTNMCQQDATNNIREVASMKSAHSPNKSLGSGSFHADVNQRSLETNDAGLQSRDSGESNEQNNPSTRNSASGGNARNSASNDDHQVTLKVIPYPDILSENSKGTYCQVIKRLDYSKKQIGWILVQVDIKKQYDLDERVKALKDASRISSSLKNFMQNPTREVDIDKIVRSAGLAVIEIDSKGNILQKNTKVEELLDSKGNTLKKNSEVELHGVEKSNDSDKKNDDGIYYFLENKLHDATDDDKKQLRDFLHLDNHLTKNNHSEISITMNFNIQGKDNGLRLKMALILRRQRDGKTIVGAFILFNNKSIHDDTESLTYPMPNALNLIDQGEVLMRGKADTMSHFDSGAFREIRPDAKADDIKSKISEVMSTASDRTTELNGPERNNEAIDECLNMIQSVKYARKRYGRNAVWLQITVQALVILTTFLTILPDLCKNECNASTFSKIIIVLPIVAGAVQSFIYCSRPRWKSAHLLLLEKKLKSEMYKFRARVGPYDAFDSKKRGLKDRVREKFVANLNMLVNECMSRGEIKSGTIHNSMNLYERYISPIIAWINARKNRRTYERDLNAINNDEVLAPLVWPWCCEPWRRTRQLDKYESILQRTDKKTKDIEAQFKNDHPTQLKENEKELRNDLKEAANRRDELKRQMDNKEKYCILDYDSYKKERLEPQYRKFRHMLPRVTFGRNVLQTFIVLFTSTGTVLGALANEGRNEIKYLIPVFLAFAAVFDNFLKFFQLESKVPVLNQYCFNELNQVMRETNAPSTLRRRLPTEKTKMVVKVEDAILSYYNFIAEEQLSEGRQKEEETTTQLHATNEVESPRKGMSSQTTEGKKANNQDLNAHALGE